MREENEILVKELERAKREKELTSQQMDTLGEVLSRLEREKNDLLTDATQNGGLELYLKGALGDLQRLNEALGAEKTQLNQVTSSKIDPRPNQSTNGKGLM